MAGPRTRTKQDDQQRMNEQRMQQADQLLRQQLTHSGYSPQAAQEIITLAHRLYTVNRTGQPARSPTNVTLAPNGVQAQINITDLTRARDYLMEVARRSRDSPGDVMNGITRLETGRPGPVGTDYLLYSGPNRGPTVHAVEVPAPVRTFVYNVTVNGTAYQVEMNTPLGPARMSSLENSRVGQLRSLMSDHPNQILAITSGGQRVSMDTFQGAYNSAYLTMYRQADQGQQPDELISISQVRRSPSG